MREAVANRGSTVFENSLKIARFFRRVQFERIFKYHNASRVNS